MDALWKAKLTSFKDVVLQEAESALNTAKRLGNEHLIGGSLFEMHPRELGITFVTDRILIMGFPSPKPMDGHQATLEDQVALYLKKNFASRFMIWNLSEKAYDYNKFENQVLEFRFPGYPSAPLDLVFSICDSMHGWLDADAKNVAVVHCQTGNGRTVSLVAAYLSWSGQFSTPHTALTHIAEKRGALVKQLIIPTQARYTTYFQRLLTGFKPSIKPIKLDRLIMNGIPMFESDGRCRPYLQIFKNAKLIYTSGKDVELKWYSQQDASILFKVGIVLDGDILIRIRHYSSSDKRLSMLRFGFHTGFLEPGNVRYQKADLDGACTASQFADDFFCDVIYSAAIDDDGNDVKGSVAPEFWERVTQQRRKSEIVTEEDVSAELDKFKFTLGGEDDDDENDGKKGNEYQYQDESFQDLADYVKNLEAEEGEDTQADLYEELRKLGQGESGDLKDISINDSVNEPVLDDLDMEAALASLNVDDMEGLFDESAVDAHELNPDEDAAFLEALSGLEHDMEAVLPTVEAEDELP